MDKLCKYVYTNDETDRLRTRAILSHIYHHALHDNWFQARDLMLMSHLQENIQHSDPSTQVSIIKKKSSRRVPRLFISISNVLNLRKKSHINLIALISFINFIFMIITDPLQPSNGSFGTLRFPLWEHQRGAWWPGRADGHWQSERIACARTVTATSTRAQQRARKNWKAATNALPYAYQFGSRRVCLPHLCHAYWNSVHGW